MTASLSDPFTEQCATLYGCVGELRRASSEWKPPEGRTKDQKAASEILIYTAPLLDDGALTVQPVDTPQLAACAAVLAAHLAVTEPAITACSGSPPPELVSVRDRCRIEIEKTRTLLQTPEPTTDSQAQPAQQPDSDAAYQDSIGILKQLAEACANAVTTLAHTCDELVNRTAHTCDVMLTIAATQPPNVPPASPPYTSDGAPTQTPNVPPAGRADTSDGAVNQNPVVSSGGPAYTSDGASNQNPVIPSGGPENGSYGAADQPPTVPPPNPEYASVGTTDQISIAPTPDPQNASYGAANQPPDVPPASPDYASVGTTDRVSFVAPTPDPEIPSYGPAGQTPDVPIPSPAYTSDARQQDPASSQPVVGTVVVERASSCSTTYGRSESTEQTPTSEQLIGGVFEQLFGDGTRQQSAAQAFGQPPQPASTAPATALFLNNLDPGYQEITRRVLSPEPANLSDLDLDKIGGAWNSAMAKSLSTVRDSGSPYRAVDVLELFRLGGKLRAEKARHASRAARR